MGKESRNGDGSGRVVVMPILMVMVVMGLWW